MDKQSISKRAFAIAVVLALSGCASSCEEAIPPEIAFSIGPNGTCPEGFEPGTFMGPGGSWHTGGGPTPDPSSITCCYWQGGGAVTVLWQSDVAAGAVKDGEPINYGPNNPSNPARGCSVAYAICSLDGTNCLGVPTSTSGVGQPLP